MKTIDLRREDVSLDALLQAVGQDPVRITSKDGHEFVLEAADAIDREAEEYGRSERFMAFLAERSAEPGRMSLDDVEALLQDHEGMNPDATADDTSAAPERLD